MLLTHAPECAYMSRSTRFGIQSHTGSFISDSCLTVFFHSPVCFCGYPQRVPDAVQRAVHSPFLTFLSEQINKSELLVTQRKLARLSVTLTSTWRPPLSFPDLPTMHRGDIPLVIWLPDYPKNLPLLLTGAKYLAKKKKGIFYV